MTTKYYIGTYEVVTSQPIGLSAERYSTADYFKVRLYVADIFSTTIQAYLVPNTIITVGVVSSTETLVYSGTLAYWASEADYSYVDLVNATCTSSELGPTTEIMFQARHVPEGSATTDFEEAIVVVPAGGPYTVTSVGIVPDSTFGQATNYATLALINKGIAGIDTTTLASNAFSSVSTVLAKNSLGTITTPAVVTNSVLTFKKTHTLNGQIVPASIFYIGLTKS